LLIITQTSLQQSTHDNTKNIQEVAENIDQTTKNIAVNTEDIVQKAREMIVGIAQGILAVQILMFPTGSRGSRSLGQTKPCA